MDDVTRTRRFRALSALAVAGALLAGTAACGSASASGGVQVSGGTTDTSKGWHGTLIDPAAPRPDFTLTDTSGASYDFNAMTKGKPTLLFFGYTTCPDICTPVMADLQAALEIATPEVRSQMNVVFVTTDAHHDTGPVLRTWLDQFNSSFVGLTGTDAQLTAAQTAVGVPISEPGPVGADGYPTTFGHAAQVTAWATDDENHTVYLAGTAPRDIAHDLPLLIKPRSPNSPPRRRVLRQLWQSRAGL